MEVVWETIPLLLLLHVEAIKLRMENKSLWAGFNGLAEIYTATKELPGYKMLANLPTTDRVTFGTATPHGNRLINAEEKLTGLLSSISGSEEDFGNANQTEIALKLQECVNAYLEFRELIPLSAIKVMAIAPGVAGKGKGEAGHASVLASA